ncbi:MAG: hypothetical protein JJU27_06490 [Gammaproteobacteria bacterium]|nr:hypothetical protein [Gammaproteobacteria bacterium]
MLRMNGIAHDVLIWGIGIVALAGVDVVHGDSGRQATVDDSPVAFSGTQTSAMAGQSDQGVRLEEELRRLDLLMDAFEELRFQLDRTQFDVEALSLALQPGGAIAYLDYVTNQVYFEQYPGLLRGAAGALMSRAGNALDQAVLLATLMSDGGYDVRIVRTELTGAQAQQLIEQMLVERSPHAPPAETDVTLEILEEIAELVGRSPELIDAAMLPIGGDPTESLMDTAVYESTLAQTAMILELLAAHDVPLGDPDYLSRIRNEAKDYFWVEYRRTQANPWRQAHPVFRDPPDWLATLESLEILDREVPEPLQYRIRFVVYAQQKWGHDERTHMLMAPWEVPVANLAGRPQVFQLTPDSVPDEQSEQHVDWDQLSDDMRFMFPRFGEFLAPGAVALDIRGNVADPEAAASPMAGVFATGAQRVGEAAGALDALGQTQAGDATPEAFVDLIGVYAEYSLIAPGGQEISIRRDLLDPETDAQSRLASLLREQTFMVFTGGLPDAFIINAYLDRILALRETFRTMIRLGAGEGPFSVPAAELSTDTRWLGHLILSRLSDAENGRSAPRTYRNAPGLVIYETDTIDLSTDWQRIDIATNPRRPLDVSQSAEPAGVELLVRSGVWESHAEGIVIGADALGQAGTIGRISAALAAGEQLEVIHPFDVSSLRSLRMESHALEAIRQDLESGYAVIVPRAFAETGAGWWRIDPMRGNTLAMIADGRGGQVKEYMTVKEGKGMLKLLKTIRFSQHCFDGTLQNVADAMFGFITVMYGDVGTYLRSVYGDDLDAASERMNACERTIVRMLISASNRLP